FAPNEDENEGYPGIGDDDTYEVSAAPATFVNASANCTRRGGRLAELSSTTEATALSGAISGQSQLHWIGGQLGYRHRSAQCARNFVSSQCLAGSETSYRWVSDDTEFARGSAAVAATQVANTLFAGTSSTLSTRIPSVAGVAYSQTLNRIYPTDATTLLPYVCRFEAVDSASFFKWGVAANLGAAAGVGLSVCSPSDAFGVCINGSLNVVSLELGVRYTRSSQWLESDGAAFARFDNQTFSIPWAVSLFAGSISASINLDLGLTSVSVSWNIVTFDGFRLADGNLYELEAPSLVRF
ncbi:MAG: hypothetical protein ACI9KE_004419, partial [Polyangiales bacterium]